jgi:hypothetical protein
MKMTFDFTTDVLCIEVYPVKLTTMPERAAYHVDWDPTRFRVGAVRVPLPENGPMYVRQPNGAVEIRTGFRPFHESVELDQYCSLDLAEDGGVICIHFA